MEAFKRRPDLAIEALWSFMRSVFDPDFMEAYQQVWTTFADMSRDPTVEVGELVQEADFVLTATNHHLYRDVDVRDITETSSPWAPDKIVNTRFIQVVQNIQAAVNKARDVSKNRQLRMLLAERMSTYSPRSPDGGAEEGDPQMGRDGYSSGMTRTDGRADKHGSAPGRI